LSAHFLARGATGEPSSPKHSLQRRQSNAGATNVSVAQAMVADGLLDWRVFRIPVTHRRFVLGRWYIALVRKMVQNQTNFLDVVKMVNDENRDMKEFVRLCWEHR